MLTVGMLKAMPKGTVFATGTAADSPEGIHMTGSGKELRWIAQRGDICDWTIYYHQSEHDIEWLKRFGDKVISEHHVRKLVPCDDGAFIFYRK